MRWPDKSDKPNKPDKPDNSGNPDKSDKPDNLDQGWPTRGLARKDSLKQLSINNMR